MAAFELTPKARQGLAGIVVYVDRTFGPRVASRVLDRLTASLERLAASPDLGHRRIDLCREERVLFWSVGPTLIAYRRSPRGIEVLAVERSHRDWATLLDRDVRS